MPARTLQDAAASAARLLNERRKVLLQQLRTLCMHTVAGSDCTDDVEQLLQGYEHACIHIAAAADAATAVGAV